jgi:hypothetical protein
MLDQIPDEGAGLVVARAQGTRPTDGSRVGTGGARKWGIEMATGGMVAAGRHSVSLA